MGALLAACDHGQGGSVSDLLKRRAGAGEVGDSIPRRTERHVFCDGVACGPEDSDIGRGAACAASAAVKHQESSCLECSPRCAVLPRATIVRVRLGLCIRARGVQSTQPVSSICTAPVRIVEGKRVGKGQIQWGRPEEAIRREVSGPVRNRAVENSLRWSVPQRIVANALAG